MQHVQPDTQAYPADRLRAHRQGDGSGVSKQGAVELEPVCCDVVLPVGPRSFPSRDRRRAEELRRQAGPPGHRSAGPLVALVRQWPSPLGTVREGVLRAVRNRCRQSGRQEEVPNKLVSLDSTVIDLCLSMYDWAKFRRTKGAVKLHLVLDHDGYLPCFGIITDGKVADVKAAHQMHFAPDTIVVDDRGYNDFRLFAKWTDASVYFVTRMKDNTLFEVVEEHEVPKHRNILKDQTIRLTGTGAQQKCPHLLRRIEA